MRLSAGSEVNEWLRLVRPLGQGGMGAVWACEDRKRCCEVAVKFMLERHVRDDPELVARFRRETEVAARIHSPHVIRGLESGETDDGIPYLVMELLEGETLADRLDRERYIELAETVPIVLQIAHALGAAHELGLVHRDIKPENVFLVREADRPGPLVKVLDFGTVKRTLERDESIVTATGVMVGTPEYMSPEQVLGSRGVDHRSDLWSLGVVAYEMLVGMEPFRGPNPQALCLAICTAAYEPLGERFPELPSGLDDWFVRAFARNPADRFTSAAAMAAELTRITGISLGTEISPEPPAPSSSATGLAALPLLVDDVRDEGDPRGPDEEPTRQLDGRGLLAATRGVFPARPATASYGDDPVTRVKLDSLPPLDPLPGVPEISEPIRPARPDGGTPTGPLPFEDEPTRLEHPPHAVLGPDGELPTSRRRAGSRARSGSRAGKARSTTGGTRERASDGRSGTRGASGSRGAAGRSGRSSSRPSQRRRRPSSVARARRARLLTVLSALGGLAILLAVVGVIELGRAQRRGVTAFVEPPAATAASDRVPSAPEAGLDAGGPGPLARRAEDQAADARGAGGSSGRSHAAGAAEGPGLAAPAESDAAATDPPAERAERRSATTRPAPYRGRDAGYLSVECEPACDEVVVGDEAIGPTPLEKYALRPGAYRVELLSGSLPTQVITVKIQPGHTTTRLVLME